MSLRKSPVRTPKLLAANRANAAKSTGPRSAAGKRNSAWNTLRHGHRSGAARSDGSHVGHDAEAFEAFVEAFRVALIPAESELGERLLRERAASIWKVKRVLDHWLERDPCGVSRDRTPPSLCLTIDRPGTGSCPGWRIKVSVLLRSARGPAFPVLDGLDDQAARAVWVAWRMGRRRAHTVVSITCTGHPWARRYRQRIRTKPESLTNDDACRNVMEADDDPSMNDGPSKMNAGKLGDGIEDVRIGTPRPRLRTKPESDRRSDGCKNVIERESSEQ